MSVFVNAQGIKTVHAGGHCALNGVLRGHFPGNQDGAVNLKSELIFIKF